MGRLSRHNAAPCLFAHFLHDLHKCLHCLSREAACFHGAIGGSAVNVSDLELRSLGMSDCELLEKLFRGVGPCEVPGFGIASGLLTLRLERIPFTAQHIHSRSALSI